MGEHILEVKDLITRFKTDTGIVTAVDGVSFSLKKGRTIGIVGESGSGKSVTALSIMRLIAEPAGKIAAGQIIFKGSNILEIPSEDMRKIRGNKISMIFQEPMTSLNPVFTIGNQIEEVIALHQRLSKSEVTNKTIEMLKLVGIPGPEKRINDYPHQLSGGMRQRVMIAMALACNPDILIADEPTTALDVTIQAQILELMKKLQDEIGMSIIFITHDLGVVAEFCHDVAVMYCGRIVETADAVGLFKRPRHPYTKGLIDSIPSFKEIGKERLYTIPGMVPPLSKLPSGCYFQERCNKSLEKCKTETPALETITDRHKVNCFFPLG